MTEEIGKVKLDYSKYPGEDFYCDGSVEDEILEIVKSRPEGEYADIIEEKRSWPVLYHLSPLRENIVDWLPMGPEDKVLEVGSGCGAITGALARKAGSVSCVELSKKRSLINAFRHRDCENVTIHVGNFKDVEPDLPRDYTYICLIGVFEYGIGYIGGEKPFETFLSLLCSHLAEGGRILIAIENKYGMKYFAGCKEDHLGTYFSGIEDYPEGGGVRTFSRQGLERIFAACGVGDFRFYYPYPDYKFMTTLFSDRRLPGKGELADNLRNFDRDRMLLFDEKSAFDGVGKDGLFSVFSNSYLAVLGGGMDVDYVKYSNDRAPEYRIRTSLCRKGVKGLCVKKEPLGSAAEDHVRGMKAACESLERRYEGGKLEINRCELRESDGLVCAEFEFVRGRTLAALLDDCLERGDREGFRLLFKEYVGRVGYNNQAEAADFDPAFSNILIDGDRWTLIDYEWTFGRQIDIKELAFRAAYCYLLEDKGRNRMDLDWILEELGVSKAEAEGFRERERQFQKFVTGKRLAMCELRDLIGNRVITPGKWIENHQDADGFHRVQVYEDRGGGFAEEHSYFVRDAYQGENTVELDLAVSGDVKVLRIDPAFGSCAVRLLEVTFNGERFPLQKKKALTSNGKAAGSGARRRESYSPSIVFPTEDPNLNFHLEGLAGQPENRLYAKMEVVRLPLGMAQDMAAAIKSRKLF